MKAITNIRKLIRETNTGLNEKETHVSVKELSKLLANTYLLYLKTQNYHWNVEDVSFAMLHIFLEEQYKQLADATDEIAERIRMLDCYAPATFNEFLKLSTLREEENVKASQDMLKILLEDHELIILELRKDLKLLEHSADEGTIDFLIGRLRTHEKMAWMLRSHIKRNGSH
jgi:starvation-inducible DNA-binding protein